MKQHVISHHGRRTLESMTLAVAFVVALAVPELAFAAGFGGAGGKACGFLSNLRGLLNIASVAVVTVAIIFSGYQIAFAHKRLSDVAPILIGGLLIGAAGQIAKWIMPDNTTDCAAAPAAMIEKLHGIDQYVQGFAAYIA